MHRCNAFIFKKSNNLVNIFNLGLDEYITVNQSIKYIVKYLKLKPRIIYAGGARGWVGDSPKIHLDINKIRKIGWKPKKNIEQSVVETLEYFKKIIGCLKNECCSCWNLAFRTNNLCLLTKNWT